MLREVKSDLSPSQSSTAVKAGQPPLFTSGPCTDIPPLHVSQLTSRRFGASVATAGWEWDT